MTHLLHIDTSSAPANSASREVAATFRQVWEQEHPHSAVTYRDLVADPVPHLAPAGIAARFVDAGEWSDEQRRAAAVQDSLISELADADAYLFSVPMYNWGIPSVFKAWLDQIIVSGRTTAFGGEPQSVAGRPATLIVSSGGSYGPGTPRHGWDFAAPYLKTVLSGALGMDVHTIKVELTMAPHNPAMADFLEQAEASRAQAHAQAETQARALTGLSVG
ncbi:NAD(P)H-dependent oxidoreductase [Streptomyces sp. NBC_00075]|uniref:FMN-dependent NADH-azoreductase n=1 Tax=Streptomyces sp. NBC_00075 TaxID=2975641 RepID=UPI00325251BB